MTLHPDILTDLVILYHAGEASQATRTLLEERAASDPAIAAALQAPPRIPSPLPAAPKPDHRLALRSARNHILAIAAVLAVFAVSGLLILRRANPESVHLFMNSVPFFVLLTVWALALVALNFARKWFVR
ncbi:MAG: hypothetical protein FJW30_22515 [Acidobacteria bacterium]|nr:hypothetical protein [Acidobacteriota bacterium]